MSARLVEQKRRDDFYPDTMLKRKPMKHAKQARRAMIIIAVGLASVALGQTTTGTVATSPAAAETTIPRFTSKALMLGEKVEWFTDNRKVNPTDIISTASGILHLDLNDSTVAKELAADTLAKADAALASSPAVVLLFTGQADETAGTDEKLLRDTIIELARKAGATSPDVFIIPSSTSLGASIVGVLREASIASGARFVETGTQFGGQPYFDTLAEINRLRTGETTLPATIKQTSPTAANTVVVPVVEITPIAGETTISGQLTVPSVGKGLAISVPEGAVDPATSSGRINVNDANEPLTGEYNPPPPLKNVDPRKQSVAPKRSKMKRPSVER